MLYICVKFHENIWIGIRIIIKGLTDRLRMERQTVDGWKDKQWMDGQKHHITVLQELVGGRA